MAKKSKVKYQVTAHRINIQFDVIGSKVDLDAELEKFSKALREQFPDQNPQVKTDGDDFCEDEDLVIEPA